MFETLTCPSCTQKVRTDKTATMPNKKRAICPKCKRPFCLGEARVKVEDASETPSEMTDTLTPIIVARLVQDPPEVSWQAPLEHETPVEAAATVRNTKGNRLSSRKWLFASLGVAIVSMCAVCGLAGFVGGTLDPDATSLGELSNDRVSSTEPVDSPQDAASGRPSVEVLRSELVEIRSPGTGAMMHSVIVTWKNTGSTPVRVLNAEITTVGSDGRAIEEFEYTIYASFDSGSGVLPGETYTTPHDRGYLIPITPALPGYQEPGQVQVRPTEVKEFSGI